MKIIKDIDQNTDSWLEMRKGKITGSKLKGIVVKRGTKRKIGFYELMAERVGIPDNVEIPPMERGHMLEDEAIEMFEKQTGKNVEKVGICMSDENSNMALSPDGLIENDGEYTEAVEVKCLSSAKHLQAVFEGIPSKYEEQKMQYFIINEDLQTLYFAFYDPRIPAKPLHIVEVKREDVEDQIAFYRDYQEQTLAEIESLIEQLTF